MQPVSRRAQVRALLHIGAVAILAACASPSDRIIDPSSFHPDAPEINPGSTHWIALSGGVADQYDLKLTSHYTTFNPECTRKVSTFGGAAQIIVLQELPMERRLGTYRAKVQIDKYLPGRCRWTFYQVIYELWPKGTSRLETPVWQWSEWIGPNAPGAVVERTLKCAGMESPFMKSRNECQYPGEGLNSHFSRPRSVISKRTQALNISFQ